MFDYVIVGAGSAGCVLANRLSQDPDVRVLLLEAGGRDNKLAVRIPAAWPGLFKTEVDWDYTTDSDAGLDGRALYWPRGKMLGGTSSMNAQMYLRGHPADYDEWAQVGNTGWGWADVLPYFRRSEHHEGGASDLHGTGGPLHVARLRHPNPLTEALIAAGEEVGLQRVDDLNANLPDSIGYVHVTQHHGRRHSTATAFLRPAMRRRNLRVLTSARTTRVLLDGLRATGVAYVRDGREHTARAAREVILCAGAIASPQLLLLSGVGPAEHLRGIGITVRHDLLGVGQNLQEHWAVPLKATVTRPVSLATAQSTGNLLRFLARGRGALTSNVLEGAAFTRTRPDLDAPDLELVIVPILFPDLHAFDLTPPTEHGVTVGPVLLRPRSVGRLRLRSADPLAPPAIQPNGLSDGEDVRVLVEGVKLARRMLRSRAFRPYLDRELTPVDGDGAIEAYARQRAFAEFHAVGTCKMGVDQLAVVDPELRVRGIEGLRVADASVMPTNIRGHTNAPTIMIAEKAADLIRGRQREHGAYMVGPMPGRPATP